MRHVVALLLGLLLAPAAARAGNGAAAPAGNGAARKVALAPLSILGEETRSKAIRTIERAVADGLVAFPGVALIDPEEVNAAIKKSKRIELRACDGEVACLAELGVLVGATDLVFGEIGGLGDSQVVYLKLINVAKATELRSTTMEVAGAAELKIAARGAAFRLLDPGKYVGRLVCKVDVDGATIYVNGARTAKSPAKAITLPVGTHALRIAHPEFRDFVRFVDVAFDRDSVVEAPMQQYPIVRKDIVHREGSSSTQVVFQGTEPTPWYRQWYTVAGGGAVLLIGSAVLFGVLADGLDFDSEKVVDGL